MRQSVNAVFRFRVICSGASPMECQSSYDELLALFHFVSRLDGTSPSSVTHRIIATTKYIEEKCIV